jgi:hypothetical protein
MCRHRAGAAGTGPSKLRTRWGRFGLVEVVAGQVEVVVGQVGQGC